MVTATENSVALIEARIAPLREKLTRHPLYASLRTLDDLRVFLESHVFAVWDFMCLLKSLQRELTCVDVPWSPSAWPASRRFLNEIVLGEESDEFRGRPMSHFEVYLQAMREVGADTAPMQAVVDAAAVQGDWRAALQRAPAVARTFVESTFAVIEQGSVAAQAAAFTFGREDVIPDMFRELVRDLNERNHGSLDTFVWYLERHIEVDGEDHGPLSLRMVADLCGESAELWEEAASAAEAAIEARLALWDGVMQAIERANSQG